MLNIFCTAKDPIVELKESIESTIRELEAEVLNMDLKSNEDRMTIKESFRSALKKLNMPQSPIKERVKISHTKLLERDRELYDLKAALLISSDAVVDLQNKLNLLQNERETEAIKVRDTQAKLQSKELQLEKFLSSVQEAVAEDNRETEMEVKELNNSLKSLNYVLREKDKLLEDRSSALNALQKEFEQVKNDLLTQLTQKTNELTESTKQVRYLNNELQSMDELLHEKSVEVEEYAIEKEKVQKLTAELKSAEGRLRAKEEEMETLRRNEIQTSNNTITELNTQVHGYASALQICEAQLAQRDQELETLSAKLSYYRSSAVSGLMEVADGQASTNGDHSLELSEALRLCQDRLYEKEKELSMVLTSLNEMRSRLSDAEEGMHSADTLIMMKNLHLGLQASEIKLQETSEALRVCEARLSERELELENAVVKLSYYRANTVIDLSDSPSKAHTEASERVQNVEVSRVENTKENIEPVRSNTFVR